MTYKVIKYIKGNPYLYEVESERNGGHVRQKFVAYLGRADKGDNAMNIDCQKLLEEYKPVSASRWDLMRSQIYIRDKGMCWVCNEFVLLIDYDLGHLVDRFNNGVDDDINCSVMHKKCNIIKPSHKTLEEAYKWRNEHLISCQ
jgi:hypothetical protein